MKSLRSRNRAYVAFLAFVALCAAGLLVRQLFDLAADVGRPVMRTNDLFSAAGSVVVLALLAVVFFGPARKGER